MVDESFPVDSTANLEPVENLQNGFRYHLSDDARQEINGQLYHLQFKNLDPTTKQSVAEILNTGLYRGNEIGLSEAHRNAADETSERIWFAALVEKSPKIADLLAARNIAGFHATGSFALAGLIEEGALLSGAELRNRDKAVNTGARDASPTGQSSVSFGSLKSTRHNVEQWGGKDRNRTDDEIVADLEANLSDSRALLDSLPADSRGHKILVGVVEDTQKVLNEFRSNPNTLSATLMRFEFPVAIGVRREFIREKEAGVDGGGLLRGQSYYGEFRVNAGVIPIEETPVIAVPEERVDSVRELLKKFGHESVEVVELERLAV